MEKIVKHYFDEVIRLHIDVSDVPPKFRNAVIVELFKIGFIADIEKVKNAKILEMSEKCNAAIKHGFDVDLGGEEMSHFSLTEQDQLNLITLSTLLTSGVELIPYHADGQLCKHYTPEEFLKITNSATAFKTYHVSYFNSLKLYINSMDSVEEILNVEYGTEIPEEYKSEVLKTL